MNFDSLQRAALSLGFATIGVTPIAIDAAEEFRARFLAWLAFDRHGDMAWMARDPARRSDPHEILANARSVISVTMNYFTPHQKSADPRHGWISRYAWGDDYHDIMLPRLRELLAWIRTQDTTAEGVAYVDTGPVLEKPWAAAAGLGFQGKHTNLIDPHRGSWFFLGEIITTAVIGRQSPVAGNSKDGASMDNTSGAVAVTGDRRPATGCGRCTKCIDVCPTHAITAPYQLDARRCISYLTIEHKTAIPRELRPLLGQHIYGCDLCQDVCPWNRFAIASPEPAFQPRDGALAPDLCALMYLTDEEFRARFRKSPIQRIKRRRLLRNVAVALGNSRDADSVPALTHGLRDTEPLIRAHAAWALGQIATVDAVAALHTAQHVEMDNTVRSEITSALRATTSPVVGRQSPVKYEQ